MSEIESELKNAIYGQGDGSYQSAGGEEGVRKLVDDFYDAMSSLPDAAEIRDMHPKDLTGSRDKLTRFLCGWLGGPKLYQEKYGRIHIPVAHNHLKVGVSQRDAWLACMEEALKKQTYSPEFKAYLMAQLFVPAERIRNSD